MRIEKRTVVIERMIKEYPSFYREFMIDNIKNKDITSEMWPTEIMLSLGNVLYKVKKDQEVWGESADPYEVIKAQCHNPDNSIITFSGKDNAGKNIKIVWTKNGVSYE